ncbi:MAG: 50S ribosomal protein L9 [Flavobacteriales bacterium]|nr:50S ribosomal protein L9 [Flavobacteriales bacterium]|tara:strand:- start:1670 stop:2113 length:444 start_codon:yes stop_codon:yes gene_type:complete
MKIILKKDVEKLGFKNEIVSVKDGYARNFLIPKGLAILATESARKILAENLRQQTKKEDAEVEAANKLAEEIKNSEVTIKVKVAEDKVKLFGSVKVSQLTDALSSLGHNVDSKFIKLTSIKEVGDYTADIRLHRNVSITLPFKVIAE